jgi:hypothetical protein
MGFPVIQNGQRQWQLESLDYDTFKEIRKSIRENGANGPFTKGIIDPLANNYHMTPATGNIWLTLVSRPHGISHGEPNSMIFDLN